MHAQRAVSTRPCQGQSVERQWRLLLNGTTPLAVRAV